MTEGPAQIGRYTVERSLGEGGMGQVFLAYSPGGDPVAVKVIRNDRLDPDTRARFEKEALIARTVVGTNRVARFLDADPYAAQPWMAVEYVPGRTVHEQVRDVGTLPAPLVASLGALLAEGLAAVHAVKLLHRDLKPQNVMLGRYGPIVIDFGLGAFLDKGKDTLSHSGMIIGTVRCMPPEQALGRMSQVKEPADVYGLGTVLLYAAAGHYPYDGDRWEAIVAQVTNEDVSPDLTGVPAALAPLISAMLSFKPGDRPSLDEVTSQCVTLLKTAGTSPAAARHALIDLTTAPTDQSGESSGPEIGPSPSLWDRIPLPESSGRDLSYPDEDGEDSPLDRPADVAPGNGGDERNEGSEEADEIPATPQDDPQQPSLPATEAPTSPVRRRRTVPRPASQVVAEELRSRYAMQSAL